MTISKLKLGWKLITGGMPAVWEYAVAEINERLSRLPGEKVARYARITGNAAAMLKSAADSMLDGRLTTAECAALISEGRALAAAWKEEARDEKQP